MLHTTLNEHLIPFFGKEEIGSKLVIFEVHRILEFRILGFLDNCAL